MKSKILGLVFLSFFALNVTDVTAGSDTWTPLHTIESIQPHEKHGGGLLRVSFSPAATVNPANCASTTYYDLVLSGQPTVATNTVISALYLAFATGRQVYFFVDGNNCSSGLATFTGLIIPK